MEKFIFHAQQSVSKFVHAGFYSLQLQTRIRFNRWLPLLPPKDEAMSGFKQILTLSLW